PDPASNVVVGISADTGDIDIEVDSISAGSYAPVTQQWTIATLLPNSQEHLDCSVAVRQFVTTDRVFLLGASFLSDTTDRDTANNHPIFYVVYVPSRGAHHDAFPERLRIVAAFSSSVGRQSAATRRFRRLPVDKLAFHYRRVA